MHGAKLSREAIVAGGSHWRLHLWVMCSTFIVFPVLGVLFAWWAPVNVDPALYTGFIYLCILPATVQSAIAFTSLAGGNVAAAVCSASASSLLGIFISPLLVGLLMNLHGAGESGAGWQNHAAAAAAVCAGTSLSSVDWQLGGKT
jgi:sodium/bile acid cotransporter 7